MEVRTKKGASTWTALSIAVAATVGSGVLMSVSAASGASTKSVYVPITPCRVMDTRTPPSTVGPRNTPLGAAETYSINVIGIAGNCNIPTEAIGLGLNVTAINPTAASFLTVFPSLEARPLASSLNWVAGQPPTPNAVTTNIGIDGKVSFYNNVGTVDLAADVVGFYVSHEHNIPITGGDILDGTISSADILDGTITGADVADFSLTNQDVGVLFAQVNSNGTIANSSGGVTGIKLGGTGFYEVDFGLDITACAFVATQGEAGIGFADGAIVGVTDRLGNSEAVFVATRNNAGTLSNEAFQLVVVC
jgi:hypothetical protein